MLRFVLFAFVLCSSSHSFSQGGYAGEMTDNLFQKLTPEEQALYRDCLWEMNLVDSNIRWLTDSTNHKLGVDNYHYSTKIVRRHLQKKYNQTAVIPGKYSLQKPEYIIFISRRENDTGIIMQKYF